MKGLFPMWVLGSRVPWFEAPHFRLFRRDPFQLQINLRIKTNTKVLHCCLPRVGKGQDFQNVSIAQGPRCQLRSPLCPVCSAGICHCVLSSGRQGRSPLPPGSAKASERSPCLPSLSLKEVEQKSKIPEKTVFRVSVSSRG